MLEKLRLDGKVAIVTGAGRGLGRQMALALAEAGADVVCAARTLEQVERTAEDIRAIGRRAVAQSTDVRDSAQCDALIQRAAAEFGRLDIMLSNAGIGDMRGANAKLWDVSDDDWHDTLDVNLSSAFYCARAASKQMSAEDHGGVMINVASGTAMRGYPLSFGYGAAIACLFALPLADKLSVKNSEELVLREMMVKGLASIQSGDSPRVVEQKLKVLLPPALRAAVSAREPGR